MSFYQVNFGIVGKMFRTEAMLRLVSLCSIQIQFIPLSSSANLISKFEYFVKVVGRFYLFNIAIVHINEKIPSIVRQIPHILNNLTGFVLILKPPL